MLTDDEKNRIKLKFGEELRDRRLKLGISQDELAFRSGLHRTYVGSVERGERNLSLENIFVFAKALRCDADQLLNFGYDAPKQEINNWITLKIGN